MSKRYSAKQRAELREKLLATFTEQGFEVTENRLQLSSQGKDSIREAHAEAVRFNIDRATNGLRRHESALLSRIAAGHEVCPKKIRPVLVEVRPDSEDELLFRYAKLHWSIPISAGYGRRLRFVVYDKYNDKLIGIIGMSDPVFALGVRDEYIGWTKDQRRERLANVMDLFVLGAVPPYNYLLFGKLVAMLATCAEVRGKFAYRYGKRKSLISERPSDGRLALLTTTSALGRSSIYNRLRYRGESLYISLGFTRGSGEFHFYNGFYRELRDFVSTEAQATAKHKTWGNGFRNKREVARKALQLLDLPRDFMYHGVPREVFAIPLAKNSNAFLRGEYRRLQPYDRTVDELFSWFQERWLNSRIKKDARFRSFDPEAWRLWRN